MFAPDSDQPGPDESADDLYQKHQKLLDGEHPWLAVWDLISTHEFFQDMLELCVERALRRTQSPGEWSADIKQDALIRIGAQLQKNRDLGFDPSRGSNAGWLDRLTYFACLKALAQFRESRRTQRAVHEDDRVLDPREVEDLLSDLNDAVRNLSAMDGDMLIQFFRGTPVEQIAQFHGCSARTVYRRLHNSLEIVKRQLEQ